jgi:alpha-mannosidase
VENAHLRVAVDTEGRVSLVRVDRSFAVADLIGFEDAGDRGDLYTPSLLAEGARPVDASVRSARLVHRGPLRAEWCLTYRLRVPARLDATRQHRETRRVEMPLTLRLQLDAGASFLRVLVEGENRAEDHRLRIVFRTALLEPRIHADAMFGAVERRPIAVPEDDARMETPPLTAPLHRYVSLFRADGGCSVYSDGLAEYEATPLGSVAVTLVRAVGELSRNDLPERPGHAGWPAPTPLAQCPGPFAAAFGILPHGPRDAATIELIERTADDLLLPLSGTTLRSALAAYPPAGGITLEGEGLAFSCAKESENGEWVVLRCINLLDHDVQGSWRLAAPVSEAWVARLDETPLERADLALRFTAPRRGIVTLLVR